jgi:23S rRNA (uracil1939-C5)-methyltransferase
LEHPLNDRKLQQGNLIEVEISDLNSSGDGVGKIDGQVVFVPDTVTGDRCLVRLLKVKSKYAEGRSEKLLEASPHRIRPRCIVADKCGGCQWQHIDYKYQLQVKYDRVYQALQRIGGFNQPNVTPIIHNANNDLNYRNKSTYPLSRSATGNVQAGYYRKGSHQLINLNQCPVQDSRLNPLLAEIKQDIQQQGWSVYNEKLHRGKLRHLSLRIGKHTGEILLTLVSAERNLPGLSEQAEIWLQKYPSLKGISLNYQPQKNNIIFGTETIPIAGKPYLTEMFADIKLQLQADTFFQINTEAAETLSRVIIEQLDLQGDEIAIDAYCGIGTFTLPIAKKVKRVIGIESQVSSVETAKLNAQINNITNTDFQTGTVAEILRQIDVKPQIILLDPPRKGCESSVIEEIIHKKPHQLAYISCQPATLARDLKILCNPGNYYLKLVQPADFFPQTTHVESVAFLQAVSK